MVMNYCTSVAVPSANGEPFGNEAVFRLNVKLKAHEMSFATRYEYCEPIPKSKSKLTVAPGK